MLIIGHRGAKGLAPENTMASLEAALKARAHMIEVDVRVSSDGTAVLSHDPFVVSSEGKKLIIQKTEFTTLQLAKPDLLSLEAALHFIDRRVDMVVEVKPGVDVEAVAKTIEPRLVSTWVESDIILASFDMAILAKLHKTFPKIPIAVNERWSGVRATHRAKKLDTKRITMNQRWLWGGFVHAMAKRGYKLTAYTLNDVSKARNWAKRGLYAVITDYPDRVHDVRGDLR